MIRAFCRALAAIGWLSALAGADATSITLATRTAPATPQSGAARGALRISVGFYDFALTQTAPEKL